MGLALLLAGALAAPAFADPPPSVSEYVETVPSAAGGKVPGAAKGKARPLAPKLRRRLQREAGSDASLLEQIATDPAYGAPARTQPAAKPKATKPRTKTRASKNRTAPAAPTEPTRHVAEAAASAVVAGPSSDMLRLDVLGGALIAGLAGAALVAYRRRRATAARRTTSVS